MHITTADKLYPHNTVIVLNPHSGRIRKRIDQIRNLAAQVPGAVVREAGSLAELYQTLDEFRGLAANHLVIAGGDGTVQAALNQLFNDNRRPALPMISIIPGGTTNMTATDIGIRGSAEKNLLMLGRSLETATGLRLVTRPALQISQTGQPDIYGMFFGAGIISRGARYFHNHIKKSGLTGESASAIVILRLLAGLLLGHKTSELAAANINILDDNKQLKDCRSLVLLASTLDRLLLGMRPYWGGGSGPIHTTCISESPKRLWRSLLSILIRNCNSLSSQDGYYSRNNDSLELIMDDEFIVDGEFYNCASRNGPLRISATAPIRFLLPD